MRPPLCVLLLALPACREGSDGPKIRNLGLAAGLLVERDGLAAFAVPEAGQDATDLDGDGDGLDAVLHLYDFADDSLLNLGLAFESGTLGIGGVLVAFGVNEDDQGATDLNGDGDTADVVLHVHSVTTGVTTNTGVAMFGQPALGIASVAFLAFEPGQGASDLDGDGDADDFVVHVHDARTGVTTNAQRAATSRLTFHDHAFAFTTDEPSSAADLNGDGDLSDPFVFELYDLLLGGVEQTPLALRPNTALLAANVDDWIVLVDEAAQGLDLNGDGDEDDGVWHEVDPHGFAALPLGFSSSATHASLGNGTAVALAAEEIDGLDANGDGDQLDVQAVLHDPLHDQTFASGLAVAAAFPFALTRTRLAFGVGEIDQGEDLNGDLDQDDVVLHSMDVTNGTLTSHGLALASMAQVEEVLLLWLDEREDGLDRNADGDADDLVLTKFHPQFLFEENLGLAATAGVLAQAGSGALVAVSELAQGRDLNGDGDQLDQVAFRLEVSFPIDFPERVDTNLGVAIQTTGAALLQDGRGLVLVREDQEGVDLNGDGDLDDAVVHRFD